MQSFSRVSECTTSSVVGQTKTYSCFSFFRLVTTLWNRNSIFKATRNYGKLRAPPLLAPAPRGHCRFHVYNGLCAKKKIGLGRPLKALRPLEGPGEARDHQGPPGINAVVKRNRLSQKKISASAGLWWLLGGPDTIRDHQGLTLGSKGIIWAKKKFGLGRPSTASGGHPRP